MKAIKIINPIAVTGVNDEFKPFANVDAKYGPYTDLATARSVLEHYLTKGLTIGVIEEGKIIEYWIKDDTNEFVKKLSDNNISYKKVASFGVIMDATEQGILQIIDINGNTVLNGESFQWIEENAIELLNPDNVLPTSVTLYPNEVYRITYINNNDNITAAINFQSFIADKNVYGAVKSISTETDLSDYTPCPVERGVVYYKSEQSEQVQVDWNESDSTSDAYIKNKPNLNGYKTKQSVVNNPTVNGIASEFIDSISQNANGEIVVTKKTIESNNSKIINKSLICETKKINSGSSIKLYQYEILNNSTKFTTNVLDIRNNNDVEYTNPDIFTCNKSIDYDAYLGIMYFSSSAGTYTFMLEITNTETNKSVEHLYHVMFDSPDNGTFIFCTTCNWEIKLVHNTDYITRYLAYLLIPKEFKGTVKIKPIKYYQASGVNFGHFNGVNEITYFNVYNKNTGNTHELLLTTDEITQKTDDNIIQPYGRYNVDFLGDIGDKNVGDLLSDTLMNSLQISDLKKMLYNLN